MTRYPFDCVVLFRDGRRFDGVRYGTGTEATLSELKAMASREWPAEFGMGFCVSVIDEEWAGQRHLPWAVEETA